MATSKNNLHVREKLVELIKATPIAEVDGRVADAEECIVSHVLKSIADHLIANNVTVQEWIPVTERLPSDEKPVLAYYGYNNDGDYGLAMMFTGTLSYFCFDPNPHWQHESTGLVVTHWMPLPQPPKGDTDEA